LSEKKYRGLAESLDQLVYRANPVTFVSTYVNNAIKNIYGYTVKEWLKDPNLWIKTIHPEDKDKVIAKFKEAQKEFKDDYVEYRIIKKDGSIRQVEDNFIWEKDEQEKVISLNGILLDITERKKAEEELQRIYEYLDTILLNLPAGVAILEGPEFRYFRINNRLAEMNGLPVEYHLGKPLAEVLPDAASFILPRLKEVLETGQRTLNHEFSIRLPKDPNDIRHLMDSFFPIEGKDGKIMAVGTVVLDITERKKAEKALKKSHDELEKIVEERTSKIRQSENELEKKNIALNEIIGQIEIEKNNIKNNVAENVEKILFPILEKIKLKGESRKYVHLLESQLKELSSSYGRRITKMQYRLVPRELEVCNMIKEGMTSKEIAKLLNISLATVETHRRNIRKKLGISNKEINLTYYLKTR